MGKDTYIHIKKNWCKKCGICIAICPKGVYEKGEDGRPVIADIEKCTECGLCAALCPEMAIFTEKETVEQFKNR